MNPVSGAFWIHKPADLTSSDVVVRLKIALTRAGYCEKGFKIGHGGTLDPFATGALVVLVGEATKLADTYLHSIKTYQGIITLGVKTTTADFTGDLIERGPTTSLDTPWQKLASEFVNGEYWQTPPMYSAKKQDGRALHELARQGIEVERKAILKKIYHFEVESISETELSFEVKCESGTYVRVIAEDLAQKAGTVAHLKTLIRTQTSDVSLDQCLPLEKVQALLMEQTPLENLYAFHPMQEVATHLPQLKVTEAEALAVLNGKTKITQSIIQRFKDLPSSSPAKYFVARLESGNPCALFERIESGYRLQRVIISNS